VFLFQADEIPIGPATFCRIVRHVLPPLEEVTTTTITILFRRIVKERDGDKLSNRRDPTFLGRDRSGA
jgi:hypothetical protein